MDPKISESALDVLCTWLRDYVEITPHWMVMSSFLSLEYIFLHFPDSLILSVFFKEPTKNICRQFVQNHFKGRNQEIEVGQPSYLTTL